MDNATKKTWLRYSEKFGRFNPVIGVATEDITVLMEKAIVRGAPLTDDEVEALYQADKIY